MRDHWTGSHNQARAKMTVYKRRNKTRGQKTRVMAVSVPIHLLETLRAGWKQKLQTQDTLSWSKYITDILQKDGNDEKKA